jgi:hypothetical protein
MHVTVSSTNAYEHKQGTSATTAACMKWQLLPSRHSSNARLLVKPGPQQQQQQQQQQKPTSCYITYHHKAEKNKLYHSHYCF